MGKRRPREPAVPGSRRIRIIITGILKTVFPVLCIIGLYIFSRAVFINWYMVKKAKPYVYRNVDDLPAAGTVLVLGAQVWGPETLSHVLEDRVLGGIAAVNSGKGRKLLLSGDHGRKQYDEVNAMRTYVRRRAPSIPEQDIFMDHAGFSTYDSMYRARDVFLVDDVIIVTQEFHIARSVFIARSLGLNAYGYALPETRFSRSMRRRWHAREAFARVKALASVMFRVKPKYLGEPVPITGDGRQSWD